MAFYRIFPIGRDGRYHPPMEMDFSGDEDALAYAMAAVGEHDLDIWRLARFVGRIMRQPTGAAPVPGARGQSDSPPSTTSV